MLSEGLYAHDWLKGEANYGRSREEITILAGSGGVRALTTGMVLGKVTKGSASAAAQGSPANAGNGTVGTITVGAAAKPGVYRVTFIEPATDLGAFVVEDPDGINVGTGDVGTAFTGGGLTFTISDGSNDFASGDAFLITVAAGSGHYAQFNQDATNGLGEAAGILLFDAEAPDGEAGEGVAIVREAVVNQATLVWPSDIESAEQAAGEAQLRALGIILREGV